MNKNKPLNMNKLTIAIVLLIALVGAFFAFNSYIYQEKQGEQNPNVENEVAANDTSSEMLTPYGSEAMGVSFAYISGSEGYTLIEPENMGNEREDFVGGVVLLRTPDYEDMQNEPDRGGPPAINVRAFNAPDAELEEWLEENKNFTNYQPEQAQPITVGGVDGIMYRWEGMFNGETVAVQYRGHIYMFEGAYSEPDDGRLNDFRAILDTVIFTTPEPLTLTGTYDCLDENAVINPPSESCVRGLRILEGQTYALDFMLMSQTLPPLEVGETVSVTGVFTPTERLSASQWHDLGVAGILSVTTLSKQ